MNTQRELASGLDADVLCLQEARLSEMGQWDMDRELGNDGWQCFWGKPQPPQTRQNTSFNPSPWNATHGGVGILVRQGIPARLAPRDSVMKERLWSSNRWVHAVIATGEGNQM
eukprot:11402666-Karenia_brevis.AAC.1